MHTSETRLGPFLATTLAAWAADGSVVLSRGPEGSSGRAARLTSEGVTLEV